MRTPVRRLLAAFLAVAALFGGASPAVASATGPQGEPPVQVEPYIVGGRDATESYPWMASISHVHTDGNRYHYCGGSLVSSDPTGPSLGSTDKVVTAAHCAVVFKPGITQVRLGSYRWDGGGEVFDVAQVDVYPNYGNDHPDDVAVLTLSRPTTATPIRIPQREPRAEAKVRAIGWGATCDYDSHQWPCDPVGLQEAELRVAADSACGAGSFDPSIMLCVYGRKGQMACFGDSGGPLAAKIDGEWVLYGATSGDGDGNANQDPKCSNGFGIWTDLTKYADWNKRTGGRMHILPVDSEIRYAPGVREGYLNGGTKPFEPEPELTLPYEPGAATASSAQAGRTVLAFPPMPAPGHTNPIVTPLAA